MRISEAFKNGKAFISFITCGDPNLETTKELIYTLEKAGTDLIELGIPFSDPTAEGEVIQGANMRALANNVTTDKIFDMVESVSVNVPLAFMTYANVVFSYGIERFAKRCKEIGVSGVILPDVPFEEKAEFADVFEKYDIDFVSLIAPTSEDRVAMIASEAKGFVYLVSSLGVTGVRSNISVDVKSIANVIKSSTKTPVAIGFGISTPEQAKAMSDVADGVIVGSAIVKIIEQHGENCVPFVYDYVKSMTEVI